MHDRRTTIVTPKFQPNYKLVQAQEDKITISAPLTSKLVNFGEFDGLKCDFSEKYKSDSSNLETGEYQTSSESANIYVNHIKDLSSIFPTMRASATSNGRTSTGPIWMIEPRQALPNSSIADQIGGDRLPINSNNLPIPINPIRSDSNTSVEKSRSFNFAGYHR